MKTKAQERGTGVPAGIDLVVKEGAGEARSGSGYKEPRVQPVELLGQGLDAEGRWVLGAQDQKMWACRSAERVHQGILLLWLGVGDQGPSLVRKGRSVDEEWGYYAHWLEGLAVGSLM